MLSKRRTAAVAAAAVAVAALIWWTHDSHAPSADSAAPAQRRAAQLRAAARSAPPVWPTVLGAPTERIAGVVVDAEGPVAGATVTLGGPWAKSRLLEPLTATSDERGHFVFEPVPATTYWITARSPQHADAGIALDLRLRSARRRAEAIVLELPDCSTKLVGSVRDISGGAIVGARLSATGAGLERHTSGHLVLGARRLQWSAWTAAPVLSDERGGYTLCMPGGQQALRVEADGYGGQHEELSYQGQATHDIQLIPEAVLTGQVIRTDGEAVPTGMTVVAEPVVNHHLSHAEGTALADDNGRFRIAGLAAGTYILAAHGPGVSSFKGIETAEVRTEPATEIEVNVVVEPVTTVHGRATDDGRPLAGTVVSFSRMAPTIAQGPRIEASADGSFTLTDVPLGRGEFSLDHQSTDPKEVEISMNTPMLLLEAVGPKTNRVAGRVTSRGTPVVGATVTAGGEGGGGYSIALTDANGEFSGAVHSPGTWYLRAERSGLQRFGDPVKLKLDAGASAEGIVIRVDHGGAVSGRVLDSKGEPREGLKVKLVRSDNDDSGHATTDRGGRFEATQLRGQGEYRITVHDPADKELEIVGGARTVSVADGLSRVEVADIQVAYQPAEITGTVRDSSGQPIADAHIRAHAEKPGSSTRGRLGGTVYQQSYSDRDGRFTLRRMGSARYTVAVSAPAGTETYRTGVQGPASLNLEVETPGNIVGSLVGFSRTASIMIQRVDRPASDLPRQASVNRFVVGGLAPGEYIINARNLEEFAGARVTVRSGHQSKVELQAHKTSVSLVAEISASGHIQCTAAGTAGEYLAGSTLKNGTGPTMVYFRVPPGDYDVSCTVGSKQLRGSGTAEGTSTVVKLR